MTRENDELETLSQAVQRLEAAGYRDSFQPSGGGLKSLHAGRVHAPEALLVDEIVRFEGESDPQDESMLFALRSPDGKVRGTLIASYGTQTDPESAEVIRRLHAAARSRQR